MLRDFVEVHGVHRYSIYNTKNQSDPSKGRGSDNMPPEVINVGVHHIIEKMSICKDNLGKHPSRSRLQSHISRSHCSRALKCGRKKKMFLAFSETSNLKNRENLAAAILVCGSGNLWQIAACHFAPNTLLLATILGNCFFSILFYFLYSKYLQLKCIYAPKFHHGARDAPTYRSRRTSN